MALSHLTRKQLIELVETQLETIRELTGKNQPRLLLELVPADDCPVDEFMLAGAIYRYCLDPGVNLDPGLVADMIFGRVRSDRLRKTEE